MMNPEYARFSRLKILLIAKLVMQILSFCLCHNGHNDKSGALTLASFVKCNEHNFMGIEYSLVA